MSTQNIIQGIVSPKVVSDGSGGYKVSADLVNVDNITITGSYSGSFSTNQSGTVSVTTSGGSGTSSAIYVTGLTTNSIIIITPTSQPAGGYYVSASNGQFTVTMTRNFTPSDITTSFNWFVASF